MNTKFSTARAARAFSGLAAVLLAAPLAAAPLEDAKPPKAQAQRYVSAHIGLNNLSNWPARVNFGGPEVDARLELDRGPHLGVAFGRAYGPARYEVEYQHGEFDIERAGVGTVSEATDASGDYDVLTVNALRELFVRKHATVYGGIGVGVARVNLPRITLANGCRCLAEADRTGFAWQARLGAEHRVNTPGFVFAQVGYLRLPGPRSEGASSIRYRSRGVGVLSVGYRHQF